VVVAVAGLGLVGAEGDPANAGVGDELGDTALDGTVEDFEAEQGALMDGLVGVLDAHVFGEDEPVGPVGGVGEAGEGTVAVGVEEEFVVGEDGGDAGVVGFGPVDGEIAVGSVVGEGVAVGGVGAQRAGECAEDEYRFDSICLPCYQPISSPLLLT